MPCICYKEHTFRGKSGRLLELVKSIIGEYQEQGFDLTLRQAFYQLVARGHIPNSERHYKNLGVLVRNGRLAGLIDWSAIIDRTRGAEHNSHFDGPGDILSVAAKQYAIDTRADQDWYVETWIEKDALVGVIEPVCRELDVTYLSCRGYLSISEVWQSASRVEAALARGQEPVVLHLGDHDPSGIDMTRAIREGLRLFAGREIRVERIALNMEQVNQYRPPPNPAKETDSRYKDYVRRFGPKCWELDALDPRVIADLIRHMVGQYTDEDRRNTRIRRQQGEKRGLGHIAERWRELVKMDGSESGDGGEGKRNDN
jgi:hypothetical protein